MDLLQKHLKLTAEQTGAGARILDFLARFEFGLPVQAVEYPLSQGVLAYPRELTLMAMQTLLREDSFEVMGFDPAGGVLKARFTGKYSCNDGWFATLNLRKPQMHLYFEIYVSADPKKIQLMANGPLNSWLDDFSSRLDTHLANIPAVVRQGAAEVHEAIHEETTAEGESLDPVLAPGMILRRQFAGNLRDYSGCARLSELADLRRTGIRDDKRVLPLGRYRFDGPDTQNSETPELYLGPSARSGKPTEFQGTLIVAPQNQGKTQFILRWARAANRASYSTFIIDVKGNLYRKLMEEGLSGRVCHFTTAPGEKSDRMNFLGGLAAPDSELLSWQVRQLVHAILPGEGADSGEQLFYFQNRVVWLRSLIHVLKLYELYYPDRFPGRTADLPDLFEMIVDYQELCRRVNEMIWDEDAGDTPIPPEKTFGGVRAWFRRMALLFAPEDVPGGQRDGRYSYMDLAQGLLTPLEPFAPGGILHHRSRDLDNGDGGNLFSLDDLTGPEQVTIILTARDQELEDAVTVVSMAIKRLEQLLYQRMPIDEPREILLLLDETRRIRDFKAGRYITFAREAKAGCVLVYQSIDQIKDEREATEILENVGTQIYLGSLVGNTARRFIDILPRRYRASFSQTISMTSGQGPGGTWEKRQELIDYFTTGDLHRLPAGDYPAMVYIKEHPCGKPFMVDMTEDTKTQGRQN